MLDLSLSIFLVFFFFYRCASSSSPSSFYSFFFFFFFNDTATTEIYTLSLHDALPICAIVQRGPCVGDWVVGVQEADNATIRVIEGDIAVQLPRRRRGLVRATERLARSEEHTSELQSLAYIVCRLLLEKKKDR